MGPCISLRRSAVELEAMFRRPDTLVRMLPQALAEAHLQRKPGDRAKEGGVSLLYQPAMARAVLRDREGSSTLERHFIRGMARPFLIVRGFFPCAVFRQHLNVTPLHHSCFCPLSEFLLDTFLRCVIRSRRLQENSRQAPRVVPTAFQFDPWGPLRGAVLIPIDGPACPRRIRLSRQGRLLSSTMFVGARTKELRPCRGPRFVSPDPPQATL